MKDEARRSHPFRDLGPKEKENQHQHPGVQQQAGVQQSVFQTPVDTSTSRQEVPDEVRAAAEERKRRTEEAYQAWLARQNAHCIGSALILGLSSALLALPVAQHFIYPLVAGILGLLTGAFIGYNRIDHFWSRLIHPVPQIIWSLVAIFFGWQSGGLAFMITAFSWLFHFVIASVVAIKIQLEDKGV